MVEGKNEKKLTPGILIYYYLNREWLASRVSKQLSTVIYLIEVGNATIKAHWDQIKRRHAVVLNEEVIKAGQS
ncbi:hypothetical protein DMENIID0001_128660 [Sergentomyia squamirostris]